MAGTRKRDSRAFKARVALEAAKYVKTLAEAYRSGMRGGPGAQRSRCHSVR